MLNPIRFSGLSLNSDELAIENGELAVCAGVELKDGFLRPSVLTGSEIGNLAVGDTPATLLYVHNTGSYVHYLAYYTSGSETKLVFFTDNEGSFVVSNPVSLSFDISKIKDIDSVGNTLVLIGGDGSVHYLLWHDNAYEELPQKPPMLDMAFRLSENKLANYPKEGLKKNTLADSASGPYDKDTRDGFLKIDKVYTNIFNVSGNNCSVKDEYKQEVQNLAYALVNECNTAISRAGHFYAPFMVRYCYRLFDGSYFMHSAPVFLSSLDKAMAPVHIANAGFNDSGDLNWKSSDSWNESDSLSAHQAYMSYSDKTVLRYAPLNCALEYQIVNRADDTDFIRNLNKWKDIIKSVDIFITPPQTPLTTDREITTLSAHHHNEYEQAVGGVRKGYEMFYNKDVSQGQYTFLGLDIPQLSEEEYQKKIRNTSTFFLLKSIDINNLPERIENTRGVFAELDVDVDVVKNIMVQKQLEDDYKTHNNLKAVGSYVYNHRVNLWGVQEQLFSGFNALTIATWADRVGALIYYHIHELRVNIHTDRGDFIVSAESPIMRPVSADHFKNLPLFYPDARANKMWIIYSLVDSSQKYCHEVEMEASYALNGAWTIGDATISSPSDSMAIDDVCPVSDSTWLDLPSKIYTSAMDNPFYFPLNGINTVGTGRIIGLASTTRALSQGQFGQFPLMAFTTDGIWALEVSNTGTYASVHPISREVATSPDGICQLDQAVIFVSSRGACLLQESQVVPLSDKLVGHFIPTEQYQEMILAISSLYDDSEGASCLKRLATVSEPPISFLQHAYSVNDSNNNRVLFIDKNNSGIALVLALDNHTWSYMAVPENLVVVPGYPFAYASFPAPAPVPSASPEGSASAEFGEASHAPVPSASPFGNTLICLDTQYDYLSTERYLGMVLTRALNLGGLYSAVSGFRQSHSIVPVSDERLLPYLFFYGSNDLKSWHFIGKTCADRSTYMPAHSFRYFRIGLLMSLRPSEQYLQTTLDITEKYSRL